MTIDKHPFPHKIVRSFFPDSIYRAAHAAFPELDERTQGRAGRDLFAGDEAYDTVVNSLNWKPVHDLLTSEDFVESILQEFSPFMAEHGCKVRAEECYLQPFFESRSHLQQPTLDPRADKAGLFVRMDFQAAGSGYRRDAHCDHRRRLVSAILFFCDADEQHMTGGDFVLHAVTNAQLIRDRTPVVKREAAKTVRPQHNSAIFFLCCSTSFHEATLLENLKGQRRWLYYSISSRSDVW